MWVKTRARLHAPRHRARSRRRSACARRRGVVAGHPQRDPRLHRGRQVARPAGERRPGAVVVAAASGSSARSGRRSRAVAMPRKCRSIRSSASMVTFVAEVALPPAFLVLQRAQVRHGGVEASPDVRGRRVAGSAGGGRATPSCASDAAHRSRSTTKRASCSSCSRCGGSQVDGSPARPGLARHAAGLPARPSPGRRPASTRWRPAASAASSGALWRPASHAASSLSRGAAVLDRPHHRHGLLARARRSEKTGLPVRSGPPQMPSRSSTSWKARPELGAVRAAGPRPSRVARRRGSRRARRSRRAVRRSCRRPCRGTRQGHVLRVLERDVEHLPADQLAGRDGQGALSAAGAYGEPDSSSTSWARDSSASPTSTAVASPQTDQTVGRCRRSAVAVHQVVVDRARSCAPARPPPLRESAPGLPHDAPRRRAAPAAGRTALPGRLDTLAPSWSHQPRW